MKGPTKEVPEPERGMKLEVKCIDMRYDPASRQFVAEERQVAQGLSDPYAEYAFTLHRTIGNSSDHRAYFDIRSSHLQGVFEAAIGRVEGISWTAKPLRVRFEQ